MLRSTCPSFSLDFPQKKVCVHLSRTICSTCPSHLSVLDLKVLIICDLVLRKCNTESYYMKRELSTLHHNVLCIIRYNQLEGSPKKTKTAYK